MFIDKKGKLFGKISIIDLGLFVLIVLIALGTYSRFHGSGKAQTIAADKRISYVVEIREAKKILLDDIKVGDLVSTFDSNKQYGKVTSITAEPYKDLITDINGNLKESVVPDQWKISVTIEADGIESGDGFYVNGRPFRVSNNIFYMKTKYVQFGGYIMSISKI